MVAEAPCFQASECGLPSRLAPQAHEARATGPGAAQKKKAPTRVGASGPARIIPAASYSPTRLPVPYHRLRKA
jgi:hypothetical protein